MDINIEKYLTEDEMKNIAERIYTERINAEVDRIIEARTAGNLVEMIFSQIVTSSVTNLSDKFKDNLLSLCESEIARSVSNNKNYDDTLRNDIRYSLQTVSKTVINENIDNIKLVVYDKILECSNEMVAMSFIGDIIRSLDLNTAVKEVLQNRFNK